MPAYTLLNPNRLSLIVSRQWVLLAVLLLLFISLLDVKTGSFGLTAGAKGTDGSLVSQSKAKIKPQSGGQSVANVLNEDGSVKPGANGSFDVSGFRMEYDSNGAPRFVAAPTVADPCAADWDTQFGDNGLNQFVTALAVMGSDIYVGGSFTIAGGAPANRVAKFNTATGTWSSLGNGNGNGASSQVNALAVIGGDLYVGGFFTKVNVGGSGGTPEVSASYIAKFNTTTHIWSALSNGNGNGVNDGVWALAVMGNDLYVGGWFVAAGNVSANHIVKFSTISGTWSALSDGNGNGVSDTVKAMAIIGSNLYVGGSFTIANVGGSGTTPALPANYIAKFDTASSTWSALGAGAGNGVRGGYIGSQVLALSAIGSDLYVGGFFMTVNAGGSGGTPEVPANNIAKINTTTGIWSALSNGNGNGVGTTEDYIVHSLAVMGNDLYVGGSFRTANVGGSGGTPVVPANYVAKFNTTESTWSALSNGNGNGINTDRLNNYVSALAVMGTDLYVGGYFTAANAGGSGSTPEVPANRIARFNAGNQAWNALGDGNGVKSSVNALAVIGSDLYVGGNFTMVGNVSANRIAKFNTTTGTWSALNNGNGNGVNNYVYALAVIGSDLYVGGYFKTANYGGSGGTPEVSANYVAKFSTTTHIWSALSTGNGNGVNNYVFALAAMGSDLYVGGYFTIANLGGSGGTPILLANRVARFNTTTGTWSVLNSSTGNGVNSTVFALAVMGSDLYVGGNFNTANAGSIGPMPMVSANYIARFDTTTQTWSALRNGNGNGVNSTVNALAVMGSDLYVGGYFTSVNVGGSGATPVVPANRVAKFNTTTPTWSALSNGNGNGVDAVVNALAVRGTELDVGGGFVTANLGGTDSMPAVPANRVAKFNTTASAWSALSNSNGNGVNLDVRALAVMGHDLYLGGDFTTAGGGASLRIAHWFSNTEPTLAFDSQSLAINGSLNISPTTGPADDGTITSIAVQSPGTYTGGISVDNTTGVVSISNATPPGNHTITIRATDNCGAFTDTSFVLHVTSPADVSGTKTASVRSDGTITYTVVLSNSSASAQFDNPGDEFKDVLPADLTLVSASATSGVAVADVGTRTVTWNGNIPAGGSVTVTITATNAFGIIFNQGTINYDADGNGTNEASRLTDDPGLPGSSDPTVVTGPCGPTLVTNNNDIGPGSLRTIINGACADSTITFDMSKVTSPITLTSGELLINKNLTIEGPGANLLTVMRSNAVGTPNFRIFEIAYARITVNISGITITNGLSQFDSPGGGVGGGILVMQGATLNLQNVTVSGNKTGAGGHSSGGSGGGILNEGTMTIANSTISGNQTEATITWGGSGGGGIYNRWTMTIVNSTISGNQTGKDGDGGGIYNNSTMTIVNSTISNNTTGVSGVGGGVRNYGTANVTNTIIAGNLVGAGGEGPDFFGYLTSQDYNLIGNTASTFITGATAHNILNQDAKLGPLANNGGPTQTMALLAGSPAFNAGDNTAITNPLFSGPPFTDQRGSGFDRIFNGTVDIGAFEAGPRSDIDATMTVTGNFSVGGTVIYTVVISNDSASPQLDNAGDEFKDVLPPELSLVSALATSGTAIADIASRTVTWNGSIPANSTVTLTIAAINNGYGIISNQGTMKYDGDGDGTNEEACLTDDPAVSGASDPTNFTGPCGPTLVTNSDDSGAGSLRTIIKGACADSTITFDMSKVVSPITLTSGELLINKNLTIAGPGANLLTVMRSNAVGTPNFRIFEIAYARITVNISGITITNGLSQFDSPGGGVGGGILVMQGATLNLNNVTVSGNKTGAGGHSSGGSGGGILNEGTMTIANSTISGNQTEATITWGGSGGGGIYNRWTMTIVNSTISGNQTGKDGDGGGIYNNSTMTIVNSTISGNQTGATSGGGGGVRNYGTANVMNTIIAGNLVGAGGEGPDFFGDLTSQDYNLIGNTASTFITGATTHNILNQDAKLGPLANNGGPTQTMVLLAGSPAINAGDNTAITNPPFSGPPFTDQRGSGFDRIVNGTVDIGAFELAGSP